MVYPKTSFFRNYVFFIDEQVYEPAEDTFLIAENLEVTNADVVLEMGTGCGILAILVAKKAKSVVAVDINPFAIKCATKNAEINCVKDKIEFRLGDLFNGVKNNQQFSLILFNSPYLPSTLDEKKCWIDKAWVGGPSGRTVIDEFIKSAPQWLIDGGRILLVQSSLSGINKTIEMFKEMNLKAIVVAKVKVPFETIVLVEAKK
jgi:release factor glutamine methyltransferase